MSPFKDKHGHSLTWNQATQKISNRLQNYWLDLILMKLNFITWVPIHTLRHFSFKLAGLQLGTGSTIHTGVRFYQPSGVSIGKDTIIGDRCFLDGRASLTIGDHVDIASQVLIYNSEHDVHSPDFHPISEPVTIQDYVFIGPRAIILPGVTIHQGAVVAAGAVVTKDVPEKTIVGGVPAKKIGERKVDELTYKLGRSRLFQ